MEQKDKDAGKKEAYEKPEVKSEDLEIWVYGYSSCDFTHGPGNPVWPKSGSRWTHLAVINPANSVFFQIAEYALK